MGRGGSGGELLDVWLQSVPPAPAERDEERDGILEPLRLRFDVADQGLLELRVRGQELEVSAGPGAVARLGRLERLPGRAERVALRPHELGVVLEGSEAVGDLLDAAQDGFAVGREGGVEILEGG